MQKWPQDMYRMFTSKRIERLKTAESLWCQRGYDFSVFADFAS